MCFVYLLHYQLRKQRWERFSHSLAGGMHDHLLSLVRLFVILWTVASQAPLSMGFSRQEVGCYFFLQRIFLTQGLSPHLLCLLHWQANSLPLSHLGSL